MALAQQLARKELALPLAGMVSRRQRPRVVAWLAIASGGEAYDAMKLVGAEHLNSVDNGVLDIKAQYVYGTDSTSAVKKYATPLDKMYDVPESMIPGILDKSVLAMRAALLDSPDYVIRTNASTWFHWDKLAAWLENAPRTGLAAGYSPDQSHLCGCCVILSADVARKLTDDAVLDKSLIDDLAMSKALRELGVQFTWIPRIDILDHGIVGHGSELGMDPADAFQLRIKGCLGGDAPGRMRDPAIMANLMRSYRRGTRDIHELLHAGMSGIAALHPVE